LGPGGGRTDLIGLLAITGACASWALDNNLTQRLSLRDPIAVTQIKTLGAGICSALIARATGGALPGLRLVAAALALGTVSYGVSLILNMRALRLLGAARQAAYFATAPFAGALASIPLLGDRLEPAAIGASALMLCGVVLLLRERHGHAHTHEPIEHDHLHVHDEHHRHSHAGRVQEPHTHPHRHDPVTHDHPHVSDLHHRHRH
jgi:drug/metabolite transporter (DMT)-like permease